MSSWYVCQGRWIGTRRCSGCTLLLSLGTKEGSWWVEVACRVYGAELFFFYPFRFVVGGIAGIPLCSDDDELLARASAVLKSQGPENFPRGKLFHLWARKKSRSVRGASCGKSREGKPLVGTPQDVGPCFRRNFIPRRPNLGKNQPGLPNHNPKPTPAWLGGWVR